MSSPAVPTKRIAYLFLIIGSLFFLLSFKVTVAFQLVQQRTPSSRKHRSHQPTTTITNNNNNIVARTSIMVSPAISTFSSVPHLANGGGAGAFPLAATPAATHNPPPTLSSSSTSNNNLRLRHAALLSPILSSRGGGAVKPSSTSSSYSPSSATTALFTAAGADDSNVNKKCPFTKSMAVFGSFWGSLGVVYILAKAIKRVLPIAMEPIRGAVAFTPGQWRYGLFVGLDSIPFCWCCLGIAIM